MSKSHDERRLDPRAPADSQVSVEYILPGPRARDLSVTGVYICDDRPFQRGTQIDLRLRLAKDDTVVVRGMVRRVDPGVGMAIEFIHIDHHARRRIRDFVAIHHPGSALSEDEV